MTTPAERYAAAKRRNAEKQSTFGKFRQAQPFELDYFQVEACLALEAGQAVLVAAPTGSGKTVVGEFAIYLAQTQGRKAFYTTPIKALSNQKFAELSAKYGDDQVGLLTGDLSINGDAPIVVMTTEVLRNMLYVGSSTLSDLSQVVMDEVHYLADRSRGAVWEEVILHLPASVTITALSATVSNAEEFGEWLGQVRGPTAVVVEEHRPVPLWQYVAADRHLLDLFTEGNRLNPEIVRLARDEERISKGRNRGRRFNSRHSRHTPFPDALIKHLQSERLLPAIWFIFSRAGCDQAVAALMDLNLKLTSIEEAREIERVIDLAVTDLADEDLIALDFPSWRHALTRGIAAHHAGLIPRFKEVVEKLFQRGLIKVVFATETLALGINMPAKTVIIERLTKWNGEKHAPLTAGEYTQLTGRAGRRGIDPEGNAVVIWQPEVEPVTLGALASTRTYPLNSSFKPGYTMAVNTIASMGYERAVSLLGESFAQYQADSSVTGLNAHAKRQTEALEGYLEAMVCHLGDFKEYAQIRNEISVAEKQASKGVRLTSRQDADSVLSTCAPGDVLSLQLGRRMEIAMVMRIRFESLNSTRLDVLLTNRQVRKIASQELSTPPVVVGKLKLPKGFNPRSARDRNHLAGELSQRGFATVQPTKARIPKDTEQLITDLRAQLRSHPCHGCAEREDHSRWSERYYKLKAEHDGLLKQVASRTQVLSRDFVKVSQVLETLGYLEKVDSSYQVTPSGEVLRRLHTENDLLLAQAFNNGVFAGLSAVDLVGLLSLLVFEPRKEEVTSGGLPESLIEPQKKINELWGELRRLEAERRLSLTSRPQPGFVRPARTWAGGANLVKVLRECDFTPGDFVRTMRRLIDLLEQLTALSEGELRQTFVEALALTRRGIISESDWSD